MIASDYGKVGAVFFFFFFSPHFYLFIIIIIFFSKKGGKIIIGRDVRPVTYLKEKNAIFAFSLPVYRERSKLSTAVNSDIETTILKRTIISISLALMDSTEIYTVMATLLLMASYC